MNHTSSKCGVELIVIQAKESGTGENWAEALDLLEDEIDDVVQKAMDVD